ncbi:MAG: hypothetical protein RLN85_16670, partial [Pseudomonadales bacterium]
MILCQSAFLDKPLIYTGLYTSADPLSGQRYRGFIDHQPPVCCPHFADLRHVSGPDASLIVFRTNKPLQRFLLRSVFVTYSFIAIASASRTCVRLCLP